MALTVRRRTPARRDRRVAGRARTAVARRPADRAGPARARRDRGQRPARSSRAEQDVEASRGQAAAKADQVGQIEAQLAAASVRTERLATEVARAVEAYNGARVRLDQAVLAAVEAQRTADQARRDGRGGPGRARPVRRGGLPLRRRPRRPVHLPGRRGPAGPDQPRVGPAVDRQQPATTRWRTSGPRRRTRPCSTGRRPRPSRSGSGPPGRSSRPRPPPRAGSRPSSGWSARSRAQRETLVRALAAARHTTVRLERARQDGLERARVEAARPRPPAQGGRGGSQGRGRPGRGGCAGSGGRAQGPGRAGPSRRRAAGRRPKGGRGEAGGRGQAGCRRAAAATAARPATAAATVAAATAAAAAARRLRPRRPAPTGDSAGTASGAEAAIGYARAQIGKPYEWAADGPSTLRLLRSHHARLAAGRGLAAALQRRAVPAGPEGRAGRAAPRRPGVLRERRRTTARSTTWASTSATAR